MALPLVIHDDAGSGPPVVLLHGFPDTAATWDGIAAAVRSAGHRVIVPHLRGYHPDSLDPGRGYTSRELAEDIPALLDGLGLDSAVLVGHDWGAAIAYGAASLSPDRVRAVVAVAIPHPRTIRPTPAIALRARHFLTLQLPWAAAQFRLRGMSGVDILYRRWAPGWSGAARDACVAAVKEAFSDPAVLDAALAYYRDTSVKPDRETSRRLAMPALVVGGTRDLLPAAAFEGSRAGFTGDVDVVILDGAGHWPHREDEDAFTRHLLAFLAGLDEG